MRARWVPFLRCPHSGAPLRLSGVVDGDAFVESGELVTEDGSRRYPIRGGIARFVESDSYAANFGLQWNRFRRTQLDSVSGRSISRDRFYRFSQWRPAELAGKRVLDVGCGAGRFTEVALDAGADVLAVDVSSAVDACRENHRQRERLTIVQADLYHLPFLPGAFEFVYCFGVLQHTPNVADAFAALPGHLTPGGRLAVDLYPKLPLNVLWPKYWLRPFTRRLPPARLFSVVETLLPVFLPLSRLLGRTPRIGRRLRHVIPVMNYEGVLPLNERQLAEWALLDTVDMLGARYDQPQTKEVLQSWFARAGLEGVEIERPGFLVGRGRRPVQR